MPSRMLHPQAHVFVMSVLQLGMTRLHHLSCWQLSGRIQLAAG